MSTLKSIYLEGATGLTAKLNEAYDYGRRFIQPQYYNVVLEDAVNIATSSPMFTIQNAGSNAPIIAGYTVKYKSSGSEVELVVASPVVAGSTFNTTVAPAGALSAKSLSYSSPRPSSYTTLASEMAAAAAKGQSKFTVSIETVDNPAYLRLNGNYLNAYLAGIYYALDAEGIFNTYEVTLSLDTSDSIATKIKFSFTLGACS